VIGVRFLAGKGLFSSMQLPDGLRGPPYLLRYGYRDLFPRG